MKKVLRISAHGDRPFTAAVDLSPTDASVTMGIPLWTVDTTAPILRYMLGWSEDRVRVYCRIKHWDVEDV